MGIGDWGLGINFLQNDKNKFSKSQKSLKLVPREL